MVKKPNIKEIKKKEELGKDTERYKIIDAEYKTIFDNSTDFIFMINKDKRVISANPEAVRFLNKKLEEVVGKSIFQLFPEEISNKYSNSLKKAFNSGDSVIYDSEKGLDVGGGGRLY